MRKGVVALAIGGLVAGAGIGAGPVSFRAGPAQRGTAVVLTANLSIFDKYCDGRDPALASGDRRALSTAIYGRSIVLHFDDADDMAWAPQTADLITSHGTGTETSVAGYPDTGTTAVSDSGTVDLTVGGGSVIPLNISASNNLTGLMNADRK